MPDEFQHDAPQNANDPSQPSSGVQAGDPNAQTTPDGSLSETPPEPTPRGLRGSGLRYQEGDGVPSWAVGRTADEILSTASELYDTIQRGASQPSVNTPPPPQTPLTTSRPDPSLIYSNPDEYHRQMEAWTDARINERLEVASQGVVTPLTSMAKAQAQTHRPEIWKKYGPEVETMMANLSPAVKANVAVWRQAVDLVASNHVDEIAREKAEALMRAGGDPGSLPSSGGPPAPNRSSSLSPLHKLFSERHEAVRDYIEDRVPVEKVIARAKARGYSEEDYAKMLVERATRKAGV